MTKICSAININTGYYSKQIVNTTCTKFLELTINNMLSWKSHIDQLMSKLSIACYAIRTIQLFKSQETLRTIYFSYAHSIMTYSIILWGNSFYSILIFRLHKRIIRIIMNTRGRDSCRELFKKLKILPLQS